MGKNLSTLVLDGSLDILAGATRMTVCTDEPANFAGIAALALAEVVLDAGDFSKAAGDVSGRKVTIAQQPDLDIDVTGEADHIAYDDGANLLGVTTCTPQSLTQGGTVTVPAHDCEIQAPV